MVLLVLSLAGCATTTAEPQAPAEPEPQPTPEASNEEAPAGADAAEAEPVEADAAEAEPAEMAPEESPAPNTQGLHWTISAHPARLTMVRISGSRGHLDRRHVDTRIASMWTPRSGSWTPGSPACGHLDRGRGHPDRRHVDTERMT